MAIENQMVRHFDDYKVNQEVERFCDVCKGKIDDLDDVFIVGEKVYCEDCFDENFCDDDPGCLCEWCGDAIQTHIIDGVCFCEDCAKRRYKE